MDLGFHRFAKGGVHQTVAGQGQFSDKRFGLDADRVVICGSGQILDFELGGGKCLGQPTLQFG